VESIREDGWVMVPIHVFIKTDNETLYTVISRERLDITDLRQRGRENQILAQPFVDIATGMAVYKLFPLENGDPGEDPHEALFFPENFTIINQLRFCPGVTITDDEVDDLWKGGRERQQAAACIIAGTHQAIVMLMKKGVVEIFN